MSTLKAVKLTKAYKKRQVVKDFSLTLHSGDIVGLLGPNGAGKTTCFYMLVGLVPCDSGSVWLGDSEVTLHPMHKRARAGLGYLPQEASIFRGLNVEQNIKAIVELRQQLKPEAQQEKVDTLLRDFNLSHLRLQNSMSLSGGERRRLEIARALAAEPKFILLDEPFAGIDPISVLEIKQIIADLAARKLGILITDHNVRETLQICNQAYIVNNGEIICTGSPEEVLTNQQVKDVYLGETFDL